MRTKELNKRKAAFPYIENEVWRKVAGYSNYEVSNLGRIRNKYFKPLSFPVHKKHGYRYQEMTNDEGVVKCWYLHLFVAEAFIPNPESKPQINHKDGNKTNNHISNLEWCTASENMMHAIHVLKKVHKKKQTVHA